MIIIRLNNSQKFFKNSTELFVPWTEPGTELEMLFKSIDELTVYYIIYESTIFEVAFQKLGTHASKKEIRYFEEGSTFSALIQIRSFWEFFS